MLFAGKDPETGQWMVENEFIRLVATRGRGRAVRLIDKRREEREPSEIGFWIREVITQNSLSMVHQAEDLVTLVLSATDWQGRTTWHAWLSLTENVAAVSVKFAVFNRGWGVTYVSPHISAWPASSTSITSVRHSAEQYAIGDAAGIVGSAFGYREWPLAPQSTAYLEARVLPTLLTDIDHFSQDAAASFSEETLTIAAAERHVACRLVVGSSAEPERTFELNVDLDPQETTEVTLSGLPIKIDRFRLRDSRSRTLLSNIDQPATEPAEVKLIAPISFEPLLRDDTALASAERFPGAEHAAALARAFLLMQIEDWEGALDLLMDSTIFRGDNPIAWWAKAWCLRQTSNDAAADLANAHYLAPLDPILRADAFLAAPVESKPEALLDIWGMDPQPYLEFADLLSQCGQVEARARWLDEARRRVPCALFERLLADEHRRHGREIAAHEHLTLAKQAPETAEAFRPSELESSRF